MNDAPWGTPSPAGYWGPPDQAHAPAGPAYDEPEAAQTRPMPIVPDGPASGGDQEDDPGAALPGGSLPLGGPGGGSTGQDAGAGGGGRHSRGPVPAAGPRAQPPQGDGGYLSSPASQPHATGPGTPPAAGGNRDLPGPMPAPAPERKKRGGRDLRAAIGVGVGLGAVVVASLFLVKAVFVGVVALAVVVGLWELTSRLQEQKGIRAPLVPLAVGGAAMVVAAYVWGTQGAWLAMALTALAVLVWRMAQPPEGYLRDVTAGVFAAFYVPFLATFVALMLTADDGPQRVLTFVILTVISDTGAYAVGYRFGSHKLAPRISPGKTREGLIGAVSFAMVAGALCMQYLVHGGAWWQGLLLGLGASASATLGDLGESMIKRDLGIKDMGTLLPGHGGIMDRLDSLLPTAPVVWLLLVVFVGSH